MLVVLASAVGAAMGAPERASGLPPFPATPPTLVSTNPFDTTPFVDNGRVETLAQVGNRIIVGGTFTAVRAPGATTPMPRTYLFAYDRTTGAIDQGFAPTLDGSVLALEPGADGTSVFVGGTFKTVNGVARTNLVKLDVATGATVSAFTTAANSSVYDFASRGNNLFVIGWFTRARSTDRAGLMQVDQTTGKFTGNLTLPLATTRTAGGPGVRTVDVTPDGSKLVIGGNFTSVGGVARDQVAIVDLTTNPASVKADWNTNALLYNTALFWGGTYIRDIALSPDGSYFIVGNTWYCCPGNGDAVLRFNVNATGTDIQPDWINFTGSDTVTAVTITAGGVVYAGGHFRWMNNRYPGGVPAGSGNRYGLAALDATTGSAYDWAPGRERGYGVLALLVASNGDLIVGHDSPSVGGESHPRLAAFPAVGGRPVRRPTTPPLPVEVTSIAPGGRATSVTFTGTTISNPVTTPLLLAEVRAGFTINGQLIAATSDGLWVYTADEFGRWVRSWRLVFGDVDAATVTGLAFNDESLWYTLVGDPNLHRRSMSGDSYLIDPYDSVVSGPAIDGNDWTATTGLIAAGSALFRGDTTGLLARYDFTPTGSINPAGTAVAGPGIDGTNWSAPMFRGGAPAPIPYRPNLARGKPTSSSSTYDAWRGSARAVDGIRYADWNSITPFSSAAGRNQWWEVDLGSKQTISSIVIWPRSDEGLWLWNPWVLVSDSPITGTAITNMTSATGVLRYKINGFVGPGLSIPVNKARRYVRIVTPGTENTGVQLAEVEVFGASATVPVPSAGQNVALDQPAAQSNAWNSRIDDAARAVDGNTDGAFGNLSVTATLESGNPLGGWWQVDLGRNVNISGIRLWNRTDCCPERLFPAKVFVSTTPFASASPSELEATPGVTTYTIGTNPGTPSIDVPMTGAARYIRVQLLTPNQILSLAEVQVLAA